MGRGLLHMCLTIPSSSSEACYELCFPLGQNCRGLFPITRVGVCHLALGLVPCVWAVLGQDIALWADSTWLGVGLSVTMMGYLCSRGIAMEGSCPYSPCKYLVILMYLFWTYSCVSPMLTLFNCRLLLFVCYCLFAIYLSMDMALILLLHPPHPNSLKKKTYTISLPWGYQMIVFVQKAFLMRLLPWEFVPRQMVDLLLGR